jgi:hypothetical protein
MYYQGWVFKGIFEEFGVQESVSNGVGVFNYNLSFTVLDRRGRRKNIQPWNRSPAIVDPLTGNPIHYYRSDAKNTPMNFGGEEE